MDTNQLFHMVDISYVLCPFEGNINSRYPTGIKIYIQLTKEIEKNDKLDISFSNAKDIIDHFLSLNKNCGWVYLAFRVGTVSGQNNIFRVIKKINLADIYQQARGYFGLMGIRNIDISPLTSLLEVSVLKSLADIDVIEIQNVYYRVSSDMIAKAIEGSITNKYIE